MVRIKTTLTEEVEARGSTESEVINLSTEIKDVNIQFSTNADTASPGEHSTEPAAQLLTKKKIHQPRQKSLSNFINKTDEKKKLILDRKLLKFLIINKLDFKIIQCTYLQSFLNELRPSYTTASYEQLSNELLHEEYKDANKNFVFNQLIILSVNKAENNSFIATVKIENQVHFINSETQVSCLSDFEEFVSNTIHILESNSNQKVIGVISDDPNYELTGKEYWFFKCFSLRVKSLNEMLLNNNLFDQVNELVKNFQLPSIEILLTENKMEKFKVMCNENRFIVNYIFNLKSISSNWNVIKAIAMEREEVSVNLKIKLIDKKFQQEIEKTLSIIEIIHKKFLINSELYLSDVIHSWLELTALIEKENLKIKFESISEDFLDMVGLTRLTITVII